MFEFFTIVASILFILFFWWIKNAKDENEEWKKQMEKRVRSLERQNKKLSNSSPAKAK